MTRFWKLIYSLLLIVVLFGCNENSSIQKLSSEKKIAKPLKEVNKKPHIYRITNSIIQPVIEFDKLKVLTGKEQEIFALIKMSVPEDTSIISDERPDVNLSLVIDRSGSMSEKNKLDFVKEAGVFVVDHLKEKDKLGIVEYDSYVSTLWPLNFITSKRMVKDLINGLQPGGSTNLCGGLVKGIEEIQRGYNNERVNRIILLSDGLANSGITDPGRIARIVTEVSSRGLTVSTIGVGLDYNEDLLQNIAESGRGNYYYIENPIQMKEIFQEELSSIFKTVAKDITIEFEGSDAVVVSEPIGYKYEKNSNTTEIFLSNMYSGEMKMVLLKILVKPCESGEVILGDFKFSYYDCNLKKSVKHLVSVKTKATKNETEVIESIQKEVAVEAELIRADKEHENYVKQFEQGNKDVAERNISTLISNLSIKNATLADVKIKKKIDELNLETDEMKNAERNMQTRKAYLKKSKQKFYLSKKGKRGKYLMQKGDSSYDVKRLQQKLKNLNLYNGDIDGKYSNDLSEYVKSFQEQSSLEADGIAGPRTLKKLELY